MLSHPEEAEERTTESSAPDQPADGGVAVRLAESRRRASSREAGPSLATDGKVKS